LKHEETLNNKVLITTPKEPSVALGAMKPHFKKKNHSQKKGSYAPKKNFKNGGNKKNYDNGKSKETKAKFDGNCNFCNRYGHKEADCFKKKKDQSEKGSGKPNKSNKNLLMLLPFTPSLALWQMIGLLILDALITCFEKDKFENFHKYRKDAVVIGDSSILEVKGIGSVLIQGKILENVLYVPKLTMNLLSVIQVARNGYSF